MPTTKFEEFDRDVEKYIKGFKVSNDINLKRALSKVSVSQLEKKTTSVAELLSEVAWAITSLTYEDYGFHKLAGAIQMDAIASEVPDTWPDYIDMMYDNGGEFQVMSKEVYDIAKRHSVLIQEAIDYERDYDFSFAAISTLKLQYLTRVHYRTSDGKLKTRLAERPQHLFMRVALAIHLEDIEAVVETYDLLSNRIVMHATPTLLNAGTILGQLSSCILTEIHADSIDDEHGIFETLKKCASFSKTGSGIGVAIHKVRARGSRIRKTNGESQGVENMLRVFSATAAYVDQGGGKRKGGIAAYLSVDHADFLDFVKMRRPDQPNVSQFELQLGAWIPDLLFERLAEGGDWSMFCPDECPGLIDLVGDAYKQKYLEYERAGKARRTEKALHVICEIAISLIETGGPYILFKDACNIKNNQRNLGPIHTSNLCTEIVQYTAPDEVAVCNLASVCLPRFIVDGRFDYVELENVIRVLARNLDLVIDRTTYVRPEAERSNLRHRPFAIGVQGLADVAMMLRLPFTEKDFGEINRNIFETIQYAALSESCKMAKERGVYSTIRGSPASQGLFQHNLWDIDDSDRYDWTALRRDVMAHGLRNSLVTAVMPTASTSVICENEEGIEPTKSFFGSRRLLKNTYQTMTRHLQDALEPLGLWTAEIRNKIMKRNKGLSLEGIEGIPAHLVEVFRCSFRLKQKHIIDLAAGRGPFVDQGQSTNFSYDAEYRNDKDRMISVIVAIIKYAHKRGLLSGPYYLRTREASELQYTRGADEPSDDSQQEPLACERPGDIDCMACGA